MMHKKLFVAFVSIVLVICTLYHTERVQEFNTFMQMITDIGTLNAMVETELPAQPAATGFLTTEQRAARLETLRQRLEQPGALSAQATQEIIVDFALTRTADLLQGLADVIGSQMAEKNKAAGEGFKLLPGSLAEAAYSLYLTSKVIFKASYKEDLKELLASVRCLKKGNRTQAACENYNTSVKMISGTVKNLSKVLRPLLDTILSGRTVQDFITNEDRIIRGVVPIAVGVVAHGTDVQADVNLIADACRALLDMVDRFAERYAPS